jgi:hypothetical protein
LRHGFLNHQEHVARKTAGTPVLLSSGSIIGRATCQIRNKISNKSTKIFNLDGGFWEQEIFTWINKSTKKLREQTFLQFKIRTVHY